MNVKELSSLFNVSDQTIRRAVNELYPSKLQKGKRTNLTKEESIAIGEVIRKQGYVQPQQNVEEPQQNVYVTKNDLKEFGQSIVAEMFKQFTPLIQQTQNKQLEIKQDYYSILGYINIKNLGNVNFSDMIKYGKEARKISEDMNIDIRKIPDERFGQVNSYHISVLEKLFEI